MDINTNKRIGIGFFGCVVLAVIFRALNVDILYSIFRAVAGLAFVLFIPGYIATYAFFNDKRESLHHALCRKIFGITKVSVDEDIDFIERIALSIGLSISLVVLTVMFSNLYLSIPINFTTIVLEITFICAFFGGIGAFQRNAGCMMLYDRFIAKVTFVGHPERKKRLYIMGGVTVISLFILLDVFYPVLFPEVEPAPGRVAPIPLNLSEVYNSSMMVYSFYPQKGLAENRTNVTIQYVLVDNFDDKIAFLGYNLDRTEVSADQTFHIKYFWKALEEVNEDYAVRVDLTDLTDKVRYSQSHRIVGSCGVANGTIEDMESVSEWKVHGPGTQGSAFTNSTAYASQGKVGKLAYNFATTGNDYVELLKIVPLLFEPERISMKVYGDNSGHILRIRFIDANNEMYQPTYGKVDWIGWKYVEFNLSESEEHWGGDKNSKIDYPIKFYSIILDDIPETFIGNGTIYFDDLNLINKNITTEYIEYPTSHWKKGDIIMEEYDIKIPANMENRSYLMRIGLHDQFKKDKILPIVSGRFIDSQNRAIICRINIIE